MAKIILEGLEFFSYHGCFSEEQIIGTWFNIDITLKGEFDKSALNDDISLTVNYLSVYQTIKKEMEIPSKLLETVAARIIIAIFREFDIIQNINIKLSKLNPPLGGKIHQVSIVLNKNRKLS